jgi:hypothetical protein
MKRTWGSGDLTFAGDRYMGSTTLELNDSRMGPLKLPQHVQATRTGDCTP